MIGFRGRIIIQFNQYYHLVSDIGRTMAKKGSVRRMDNSVPKQDSKKSAWLTKCRFLGKKDKSILPDLPN